MTVSLAPATVLALVALLAGILMLLPGGRWSGLPLAAVATIALALDQLGASRCASERSPAGS